MSGGHYPSTNHTRSSQEFIAPRHRLPVIAPSTAPSSFNSTSSIPNAHVSHTSWMSKRNYSSNYNENPGRYGLAVSRDYSSIARAHCNDESSAWSNPHFSNTLGNSTSRVKTTDVKGELQQESMDLSASHHVTPGGKTTVAPSDTLSAVNGEVDGQNLMDRVTPVSLPTKESSVVDVEVKKESKTNVNSKNPSITDTIISHKSNLPITFTTSATTSAARDVIRAPKSEQVVPPTADNVEFALESMFHSENRSPVSASSSSAVGSTLLDRTSPDDMCVEWVEKLLKSPSPEKNDDDNDNLAILEDTVVEKIGDDTPVFAVKPLSENLVGSTSTKGDATCRVVTVQSTSCECAIRPGGVKSSNSDSRATASKRDHRPNDVKSIGINVAAKNSCDAKNDVIVRQIASEQASSNSSRNDGGDRLGAREARNLNEKSASKIEPTMTNAVRNDEITYVQVENELEKMFAGIEDVSGGDNDSQAKPEDLSSISSLDGQHNLSLISSSTQHSQSTTSLFDGGCSVPAKSSKKKNSKKSKGIGASAKNAKESKQKSLSSCKESSSIDNAIAKRVPVIHIEGSKENPISAQIINSVKLEEDDVSDGRASAKRKLGKSDRVVKKSVTSYAFKNYDPGTSDASWVCIFCNLCAHASGMAGEATGDLFGPYFIRTPEQINLDESKRHSRKANRFEQVKKRQKRSLSVESGYIDSSASEEQKKSLEIWAHENCIVWSSGVHLIGSKLIGLEEAVTQALNTICAHCSNKGASIGCRGRHCNSCAHYSCALFTGWTLDTETFISTCSVHSVPDQ